MKTAKKAERPWELQRYIDAGIKSECEMNQADHRPTSQHSIDRIEQDADKYYAVGVQFMATLSCQEKAQCRQFHEATKARKYWTSPDDLVSGRVMGKWMLVPFYILCIEDARALRQILTPLSSESSG